MQINIPDVPAVYDIMKLSDRETAQNTVESAEWIEKSLPELDNLIREYSAVEGITRNALSKMKLAREYIEKHDSWNRQRRIRSCQK